MVATPHVSLAEVYAKYSAPNGGGDKGTAHSYIEIYEREMSKIDGISLLEIGVWEGHSIKMWQEYFLNSEILGCDLNKRKIRFDIDIIEADATRPIPQLRDKKFDYIIDDGSHLVLDQLASFRLLWDNLKPGGKYFIEDIAGDREIEILKGYLIEKEITHWVYDNRSVKGRSDDILLVATKE
jgi:SAM-dependent methyltransferase